MLKETNISLDDMLNAAEVLINVGKFNEASAILDAIDTARNYGTVYSTPDEFRIGKMNAAWVTKYIYKVKNED